MKTTTEIAVEVENNEGQLQVGLETESMAPNISSTVQTLEEPQEGDCDSSNVINDGTNSKIVEQTLEKILEKSNSKIKNSDAADSKLFPAADIDIDENKRFVKWLLREIEIGNKEIFDDKFLEANIKKNGGIVCQKYMKKKSELISSTGEDEECSLTSPEEERC